MEDLPELQELLNSKCEYIAPKSKSLVIPTIESYLNMLPGWDVTLDFYNIHKTFNFKNYHQTLAFINAVAWIANKDDHHPEITFGYNYCTINLTTEGIRGLSKNDIIIAAKINELLND